MAQAAPKISQKDGRPSQPHVARDHSPAITEAAPSGSDLDPFTQGYVEALLSGWIKSGEFGDEGSDTFGSYDFSDLAPEALAAILRDCAAQGDNHASTESGKAFWAYRQAGKYPWAFPPLTPYLGDDGRVYLREAA